MSETEKQRIEYKSVLKIRTGDKGFRDLSTTCVAFANAQGGTIFIGYDDKKCMPPDENQTIHSNEINETTSRLRSLCFNVGLTASNILTHENGGQYFEIEVFPSRQSVATTSDGKIYIRVADKCEPVRSEDIQRLMEEKGTFQWELVRTKWMLDEQTMERLGILSNHIRNSKRIKPHIAQMDDLEIAEYYHLIDENALTNLGVLWLGSAKQRSSICYPITVQYIVYDHSEKKVRKEEWHDNTRSPMELLLDIESKAIELTYSHEFPTGLFRKQIRHYHPKLIRELLVNAFAHKSYSISSDIMIKVYPDRLEISNPGGLPLGITKNNILHTKFRRNPYMIDILSVLELMEGEGSGYDLIYELNAMEAKNQPVIETNFNEVTVIQESAIIDTDILPLLDYILQNYSLTQKSYIAFGIIARNKKILSTELSKILQLTEEDRLRSYTSHLLKNGLVITRGERKGTEFMVNPKLIQNAKANIKTSLKTIEPHILKALIWEDLKIHSQSRISEIASRLEGADIRDIRKIIYAAVKDNELIKFGSKTNSTYSLPE